MSKRVRCKFFEHGACLKGEHCGFSHDLRGPPNNVCSYYQKGACTFGSRCRYEHIKVSGSHSSTASSSTSSHHSLVSDSVSLGHPSRASSTVVTSVPVVPSSRPSFTSTNPSQESRHHDFSDSDDVGESSCVTPADKPICSFAAAGNRPRGEKCSHIHGEVCGTCGKEWLHPFQSDERAEHLRTCEEKQKHLDALKHGQEIECSVCFERILSKPTPAERKFGLLSECDHPFCISCIRNWRSSSLATGMDVNTALRACPVCRKLSYFVIPSVMWYATKEEKQHIVEKYKAKLRSIDCKYFDFGNGACPFGTSCFYKHKVKPGSYTWNNLRPPPRCRPNRCRSNMMDMADILALLEDFEPYSEMAEVLDSFDAEDLGNEFLTPEEISLLLIPPGFDTDEELTHLEMACLLGQMGLDRDYSSGDE